jgi:hypothetical protein
VRDQVLHPYKTTGKNVVLDILIFGFLDSKQEGKRFWKTFNLLLMTTCMQPRYVVAFPDICLNLTGESGYCLF